MSFKLQLQTEKEADETDSKEMFLQSTTSPSESSALSDEIFKKDISLITLLEQLMSFIRGYASKFLKRVNRDRDHLVLPRN